MTWEAEGWGEGEESTAGLESAESAAYDDVDGYYGSVADTHSAESQQQVRVLVSRGTSLSNCSTAGGLLFFRQSTPCYFKDLQDKEILAP